MDTLIAGAGIAGLAAAIAMKQTGHDVQVLERAPAPAEVGAGLALWPNGRRALASLGVEDLPGAPVSRLQLGTWRGRLLSSAPLDQLKERHGYELMIVHRAALHSALLRQLGADPVRFGSEVAGFDQGGSRVRVHLRTGEELESDLLIGADGIWSAVRRALLGDGEPRYSGATCWRGVTGYDLEAGSSFNWWGPGGEFGIFPLPGGRIYWFAVQNRQRSEADSPNPHRADLLQTFRDWPDPITAVLEATAESSIIRSNLYDRAPARTWTRGRVTLVGDAAHPMLPNAAQGACQGIEDGVALGRALTSHPVAEALAEYQRRRVPAANRLVSQARQAARAAQATNPMVTGLRDLLFAHLPRGVLLRQLDSLMR